MVYFLIIECFKIFLLWETTNMKYKRTNKEMSKKVLLCARLLQYGGLLLFVGIVLAATGYISISNILAMIIMISSVIFLITGGILDSFVFCPHCEYGRNRFQAKANYYTCFSLKSVAKGACNCPACRKQIKIV